MGQKAANTDYDTKLEYYKLLVEGKRNASKSYDQALLALAGGALGLSVTFIDNFVVTKPPQQGWLLFTAWVLFGVAICCTLTSFLTAQEAYRVDIGRVIDAMQSGQPITANTRLTSITYWLNRIALCSFAIGILVFIIFVASNYFAGGASV